MTVSSGPAAPGKDIYLHIGAHKTASTTIRRLLRGCAADLAARGVRLVPRDVLVASPFFAHLMRVVQGKADPGVAAVSPEDRAELQGLVAGPEARVLMTSEDMFKRLPLDDFYDNIGLGLRLMQALLPGHRLHVVLYVRAQPAYVESCYTQLVHLGRSLPFAKFTGKTLPAHLRWNRVCDDITAALGPDRLIVKPFEIIRDLGGAGFFHDFAAAVGIPDPQSLPLDEETLQGKRANRSFSDVAMRMALMAAPEISPKDMKLLRRFLQEHFSTDSYPRPRLFTPEETAAMKALYAADNADLFARYLPGYDAAKLGYF